MDSTRFNKVFYFNYIIKKNIKTISKLTKYLIIKLKTNSKKYNLKDEIKKTKYKIQINQAKYIDLDAPILLGHKQNPSIWA